MDTSHHLIHDNAFDVYERASYGRGCEIQPISDEKHKQCKTLIDVEVILKAMKH